MHCIMGSIEWLLVVFVGYIYIQVQAFKKLIFFAIIEYQTDLDKILN
jgi:hypothetical protein